VKIKFSSVVTLLVALGLIAIIVAISIPSLLRARVAGPHRPMPYPAAPPATAASEGPQRLRSLGYSGDLTPHGWTKTNEARPQFNTEAYSRIEDNGFLAVAENPLSTFSIDVDTASYANVRRFLRDGHLPPKDAVRIEELLNYFRYDYPEPQGDAPFSVTTEVGGCPWRPAHKLVLLGLQGRRLSEDALPPRNLVFLLDVSGSMQDSAKLPLVKSALAMLADQLTVKDSVSIVVYAGASGLALPPTSGDRKGEIRAALAALEAGGSTNGAEGIQLAYRVAAESFIEGGVNRVILATDGDFNVGVTSEGDLVRLIEQQRKTGIFLSVLGFGMGNLKDATMEKLADKGNGNYAYVDSLAEAHKVLVEEAGGTLVTIAKDVKVQVEFNPARVAAYRLIGYENRLLVAQDFNDDRKDAGDIGAGHSVTALYEVVPVGVELALPGVDPLKYQQVRKPVGAAASDEWLTVKLRYKEPAAETSRLIAHAVRSLPGPGSTNLEFSAAVAGFGMMLRDSEHKGALTWPQVRELAVRGGATDPRGYRAEFVQLVERAAALADKHGEGGSDRPRVSG
jgi:Ca-activated chloride channel family protein